MPSQGDEHRPHAQSCQTPQECNCESRKWETERQPAREPDRLPDVQEVRTHICVWPHPGRKEIPRLCVQRLWVGRRERREAQSFSTWHVWVFSPRRERVSSSERLAVCVLGWSAGESLGSPSPCSRSSVSWDESYLGLSPPGQHQLKR